MCKISKDVVTAVKKAANKLTGVKRREYLAEVTLELLDGNPRKAERVFGCSRATVEKGIKELTTGIKCHDGFSARGNKRSEEKNPKLAKDIIAIVDPQSQAAPRLETPFGYTRITAKGVRQGLIDLKGYHEGDLPCESTIGNILNRLGYRMKRVQKTKPLKKNQGNG